MHRPRPEHEDYHEPQSEPRDFSDTLDHMDF
jgi:hypothetical protein